jgi:hypothetical protein
MGATENAALLLHPVTDDFATAMRTLWREGVDRTFEAVEGVRFTQHGHLKSTVVVVSANLTTSRRHGHSLSAFSAEARSMAR